MDDIPKELYYDIFSYLTPINLSKISPYVNKRFYEISNSDIIWKECTYCTSKESFITSYKNKKKTIKTLAYISIIRNIVDCLSFVSFIIASYYIISYIIILISERISYMKIQEYYYEVWYIVADGVVKFISIDPNNMLIDNDMFALISLISACIIVLSYYMWMVPPAMCHAIYLCICYFNSNNIMYGIIVFIVCAIVVMYVYKIIIGIINMYHNIDKLRNQTLY